MAYVLPRAVIVLIGWGATYFILTAVSTHLAPAVVYITGLSWVSAGVVGFGYLYKLRREMGMPQITAGALQKPIATPQKAVAVARKPIARRAAPAKRAAAQPTVVARLIATLPRGR